MNCPHCSSDLAVKNGKTAAGSQRYKCKNCDRSFTPDASQGGRPAIWSEPMTGYERLKRHLRKKKKDI